MEGSQVSLETPTEPAPTKVYSRSKYWVLVSCLYGMMFMFGFSDNAKTIAFPMIKRFYEVSSTQLGLLITIGGIGYPLAACLGFLLVRWLGPKRVLLVGMLCLAASCLGMSLFPSFAWLFVGLFFLTFSLGLLEIGTNVVVTSLFTEHTAILMTLFQGFYGLGSISIPYAGAGMVQWLKKDYKSIYFGVMAGGLLVAMATVVVPFDHPKLRPMDELVGIRTVMRNPIVWLFVAVLAVMEILEYGTTDWSATYFHEVYGMEPTREGALFETMFFISFTAARLLSGWVVERMGYFTFFFWSYSLTLIIMIVGFVAGRWGLYILPFTGIFIGLSWPIMMCLCVQVFKENAPVVSSFVIVIGCGVNIASQLLIGVANDYIGEAWGYRLVTICPAVILVLLLFLRRMTKAQQLRNNGEILEQLIPEKQAPEA